MSNPFSQVLKEGSFEPSKGRFARTIEDKSSDKDGHEDGAYLAEASNILNGRVFKQEIDLAIFLILENMTKETYERCTAMAEALRALHFRFEDLAERFQLLRTSKQENIQPSMGVDEASHMPPEVPFEM